MVVDGSVDVGVAGLGPVFAVSAVGPAFGPSHGPVAAAVGDPSEFLDVHVDQVPRAGVFIAADDPARAPVQPGQSGQAVAGQDLVDRGGVHAQQVSDSRRSPTAVHAQGDDPPLRPLRGPSRRRCRSAGTVFHTGLAELAVAAGPARGSGNGDLETFRCPAQRPAVVDYTFGQLEPASLGKKSVRVGHEDLRLWNGL